MNHHMFTTVFSVVSFTLIKHDQPWLNPGLDLFRLALRIKSRVPTGF